MPIYEYRCEECGAVNEHLQLRRSDPAPAACKSCGGGPLERLISRTSFKLKGDGWYATDYSSSSATASGAEGDTSPGSDGGSNSSGSDDGSTSNDSSGSDSNGTAGASTSAATAAATAA